MKEVEQISYAKTVYGQEEVDAVVKCLGESTQMGNYSRKFEKEIAILFDKKYCLYVNSGSSALYIGVEAFQFPQGSEVITPALTFSTSVGCIVKNNLVPVFVDVEPLTYCIDVSQIEEQITDKTVAILAPNLMGNLCNWPEIRNIADKHKLIVIEYIISLIFIVLFYFIYVMNHTFIKSSFCNFNKIWFIFEVKNFFCTQISH